MQFFSMFRSSKPPTLWEFMEDADRSEQREHLLAMRRNAAAGLIALEQNDFKAWIAFVTECHRIANANAAIALRCHQRKLERDANQHFELIAASPLN